MKYDGTTIRVTDEDLGATLREIAAEHGLDVAGARTALELAPDQPGDDEALRPRVAAAYRYLLMITGAQFQERSTARRT